MRRVRRTRNASAPRKRRAARPPPSLTATMPVHGGTGMEGQQASIMWG